MNTPAPYKAINMWSLVSELGFIIALPLVILLWVGVKADHYFNTTPLFILIAVLGSPVLSGLAVWRKIRLLNRISKQS